MFVSVSNKTAQEQGWDILAPGGTLVDVVPPMFDKAKYTDKHSFTMWGSFRPLERPLGVGLANNLTRLLEDGSLKVSDP